MISASTAKLKLAHPVMRTDAQIKKAVKICEAWPHAPWWWLRFLYWLNGIPQ